MVRFFIDRPSSRGSLRSSHAGGRTLDPRPIAQYPSIAPPTITAPQTYRALRPRRSRTRSRRSSSSMTGLDARYITSTSDGAGSATITLTFNSEAIRTSRKSRSEKLKLAKCCCEEVHSRA